MTDIKPLTLIDGEFLHEEANDIIMNIFLAKIQFHRMRNFSSQERFGKDDKVAVARIPALQTEIERLKEIISDAKASNRKLIVSSRIDIRISDQ